MEDRNGGEGNFLKADAFVANYGLEIGLRNSYALGIQTRELFIQKGILTFLLQKLKGLRHNSLTEYIPGGT